MALYEPSRHEPLTATVWDETRAREAIASIVADTDAAFTPEGLWPIHPFDKSDDRPPDCLKPLYHGAGGVIWALNALARAGAAPMMCDYAPTARELVLRNEADLDRYPGVAAYMRSEQAAVLIGETGLVLLEGTLSPSDALADRLEHGIAATCGDNRGLVWGSAGGMLAALAMHDRTGDTRWRTLFLQHVDALWDQWVFAEEVGGWFWTQDLYGQVGRRLGALHGALANAFSMVKGRALLPQAHADELLRRTAQTLRATAVREGDLVNWPIVAGGEERLVQHCLGAPGVINVLADWPTGEIDDLLLAAGEMVWRAGPPVKFPSLCHGAAGSGYAFLKLYARTGDARWLARARRFAIHAIGQAEAWRDRYGQRKFSLWTGDLGVALYLQACADGTDRFPMLDGF